MTPRRARGARTTVRAAFWALLAGLGVAVSPTASQAQEVGGDVMIPAPRELVSSAGVGRLGSTERRPVTRDEMRAAISSVLEEVRRGTMGEREARAILGNVIVSILVKRGIVMFADPPLEEHP